jgi:hypothetical protein
MSRTLTLPDHLFDRLHELASARGVPVEQLLAAWLDDPSLPDRSNDPAWDDARGRILAATAADPALAEAFSRPLAEDEPQHEILDRLLAGEFRTLSGDAKPQR